MKLFISNILSENKLDMLIETIRFVKFENEMKNDIGWNLVWLFFLTNIAYCRYKFYCLVINARMICISYLSKIFDAGFNLSVAAASSLYLIFYKLLALFELYESLSAKLEKPANTCHWTFWRLYNHKIMNFCPVNLLFRWAVVLYYSRQNKMKTKSIRKIMEREKKTEIRVKSGQYGTVAGQGRKKHIHNTIREKYFFTNSWMRAIEL